MSECCGTCDYSRYNNKNGYSCENESSDYFGDWVEYEHGCIDYESKEEE